MTGSKPPGRHETISFRFDQQEFASCLLSQIKNIVTHESANTLRTVWQALN